MSHITLEGGDITSLPVDVIVNAANSHLGGGGGVDGAIHHAGGPTILEECQEWIAEHGPLATGKAMITGGGDLRARHVIHTVGPVWGAIAPAEASRLLADCYRNSLELATETECASIAFPNISTGVYGYPKERAATTALGAVQEWTGQNDKPESIVFACFDETNLVIYERLLES